MRIETDRARILSGVRFGRTLGSPVTLLIENADAPNWVGVMDADGEKPAGIDVTAPRPGHADLAGCQRTGSTDTRDILERASARETASRVAAGAVAKALLAAVGVEVGSYVVSMGSARWDDAPADPATVDRDAVEASDVRCPDPAASARMRAAVDAAREVGDSLGGVIVGYATGLVPGLGGYAQAADRLDGRLAGAIVSIPAMKAVEIGEGALAATLPGSQVHDAIVPGTAAAPRRASNRSGGIEGGMTNGETLWLRASMKPIPTLMRPLASVDLASGEVIDASKERSDVAAVAAAGVVVEAEIALVLADAHTRMFGDTCLDDIAASLARYRDRIGL
jgi:chorismate synthase